VRAAPRFHQFVPLATDRSFFPIGIIGLFSADAANCARIGY